MREAAASVFLWIGSVLILLAALGLLRLPDLFTRMHASTKAGTLGISGIAIAVGIYFADLEIAFLSLLLILFFMLTAPVAAHMIGRAGYFTGVPLSDATHVDELGRDQQQQDQPKRGAHEQED